jgi:hypothetical protein
VGKRKEVKEIAEEEEVDDGRFMVGDPARSGVNS